MGIGRLIAGHERFKNSLDKHRQDWTELVELGQHPHTLWIGCSDSRVIPEQITSAAAGELFVMRNIANVVPPYGTSGIAAAAIIEFAVAVLGVENIVVCGHTDCGGVGALMDQGSLNRSSHLGRWISWIQPALSAAGIQELSVQQRYLAAIKSNVLHQRKNVLSYPEVSSALKAGSLAVHGWLFDIASGELLTYETSTQEWQPLRSPPDEPIVAGDLG